MDVEKIQRINNLAVELQKQGLATSKEDAVAQAEQIFNVQDKTVLSQKPMNGGSLAASNHSNNQSSTSSLSKEKIEDILQKNTKFLVNTIKDFQEKMDLMQKKLATLEHKMLNMPRAQAPKRGSMQNQGLPQTNNPVAASQSANQVPKAAAPAQKPASHPRSGRFNDTDVSIEKFFYAGK